MKRIKFFLSHLNNFLHSRSEKGFTLAEIMVTAGIVAVLAVAIMRMTSMAQKTAKSTAQSLEVTQQYSYIQQILKDQASCTETFKTKAPTAAGIPITILKRIAKGVSQDVVGAGTTCFANSTRPGGTSACISGSGSQGKVGIYQMILKKVSGGTDGPGKAELEIHFVKGAGANSSWDFGSTSKKDIHSLSSYGSNYTVRKIDIDIVLSGNVIDSCYTTEENFLKTACLTHGGDYSDGPPQTCVVKRTTCRDVAIAAVGTVNYVSVAVGNNTSMCNDDEVLRGINTVTTVGETAIIDSTPIGFTRLQLILKCCKK